MYFNFKILFNIQIYNFNKKRKILYINFYIYKKIHLLKIFTNNFIIIFHYFF